MDNSSMGNTSPEIMEIERLRDVEMENQVYEEMGNRVYEEMDGKENKKRFNLKKKDNNNSKL